jgi:transcriptional regulator with XRE-family HTH domain
MTTTPARHRRGGEGSRRRIRRGYFPTAELWGTAAYISKIERGERRIDAVELEELARIYAKDINYFVK